MKSLLSAVLVLALGAVMSLPAQEKAHPHAEAIKVAGTWQMSMDTPHGAVKGPFEIQQTGAKLTGKFTSDHVGSLNLTGTLEGKKVVFRMEVPGSEEAFVFSGSVDGDKMSGTTSMSGNWSATRQ